MFTVTLDEALALLAAPKTRQRRAAAPPLREMGVDPLTEKPLVIKDGRFGPYVTDGESNASLRRGQTPEELTIEQASEMLAEKRAKGPAPKKAAKARQEGDPGQEDHRGRGKKTTAAKKTAAKKATKTTARRPPRKPPHAGIDPTAALPDRPYRRPTGPRDLRPNATWPLWAT